MTTHHHGPACRELLGQISEYIDGELEESLCAAIEQHLADCEDCRIVVDTTRKTVLLFRRQEPAPLPEGVNQRLQQALIAAGCRK